VLEMIREKIDAPRVLPRVLKFISPQFTRVSRVIYRESAKPSWNVIYRCVLREYVIH